MSLTHQKVLEVADECKAVCNDLKKSLERTETFLQSNTDLAIDWAGDPLPEYINEDVDGNLDGRDFTRQQVANAIGSIDEYRKLLNGLATNVGNHIGNLNQLADVEVK